MPNRMSANHPTETSHLPLGDDRSGGMTCRAPATKTSTRQGPNPLASLTIARVTAGRDHALFASCENSGASCAGGQQRFRSQIFPKIERSFRGGPDFLGTLPPHPQFSPYRDTPRTLLNHPESPNLAAIREARRNLYAHPLAGRRFSPYQAGAAAAASPPAKRRASVSVLGASKERRAPFIFPPALRRARARC